MTMRGALSAIAIVWLFVDLLGVTLYACCRDEVRKLPNSEDEMRVQIPLKDRGKKEN